MIFDHVLSSPHHSTLLQYTHTSKNLLLFLFVMIPIFSCFHNVKEKGYKLLPSWKISIQFLIVIRICVLPQKQIYRYFVCSSSSISQSLQDYSNISTNRWRAQNWANIEEESRGIFPSVYKANTIVYTEIILDNSYCLKFNFPGEI